MKPVVALLALLMVLTLAGCKKNPDEYILSSGYIPPTQSAEVDTSSVNGETEDGDANATSSIVSDGIVSQQPSANESSNTTSGVSSDTGSVGAPVDDGYQTEEDEFDDAPTVSGTSSSQSGKDTNSDKKDDDKGGFWDSIGSWFDDLFGNKDSDDKETTTAPAPTTTTSSSKPATTTTSQNPATTTTSEQPKDDVTSEPSAPSGGNEDNETTERDEPTTTTSTQTSSVKGSITLPDDIW